MRPLNRGMGLIEALVALLVLSIGLLGMAQMFITSLRNSRSALLRTHAVNLVSDMADRIRSNVGARSAYSMANYAMSPSEHDCAPSRGSIGSNCTEAELAEDDLARWLATVRALLPAPPSGAAAASVVFAAGAPDRYRIMVSWAEPGEAQTLSHQTEVLVQAWP